MFRSQSPSCNRRQELLFLTRQGPARTGAPHLLEKPTIVDIQIARTLRALLVQWHPTPAASVIGTRLDDTQRLITLRVEPFYRNLADHMRASLVIEALKMARMHGHVKGEAIFHSDRGTQYAGKDFTKYCKKIGARRSMGRTGVCWDNAAAESFFATLKNEMYYRYRFLTRSRARFAVAEYIEVFYNRKRMHSSIGYRTPAEALTEFHQAAAAA